MSLLTSQEKYLTIFLLSTALIGSVIGIFRHNWLRNPEILLSPKNLPSYIQKIEKNSLIERHNAINRKQSRLLNYATASTKGKNNNNNISSESVQIVTTDNVSNKTKSNKKKITQNSSEIININSASKEDFIKLPYIGEVKAERIIQLRNEMGTFTSIKDLEKVKGIGSKTLTRLEPFITI
ncbi:MAG: hypothetical protein GWP19_01545 [Planctomycetia bacterium]|nr:hypothetical protein [Planctomycetia bacterium]